jgi:catechol 2,3-dioxygenase-like lactoylglutathione lyase family enzyme
LKKPKVHGQWVHPILKVPDVQAAIDFYTQKLGFTIGFVWGDPVSAAGLNLGPAQVLVEASTSPGEGTSMYCLLQGVDRLHQFQREMGVTIAEAPADKPWGLREYWAEDPWGNKIGFGQHVPETHPKIPIERVAVPVRLEKRLAALLQDLADYKRMSVSECLEETLLHTFECTQDGFVASPHTAETFDVIEELKQKHSIDYDSHGGYRFEEAEP